MKKTISLLIFLFFITTSCKNNDNGPMIEEAGSANYFILNNSSSEIRVEFTTSTELGSEKIAFGVIRQGDRKEIFKDGIIGQNPRPTSSFSEITFVLGDSSGETTYVYSPIIDEDWRITFEDFSSGNYGTRFYEYMFSGE